VSATTVVSTVSPLKGKVRYQQKVLDIGNKIIVGIQLKIVGSKVIRVISLQ